MHTQMQGPNTNQPQTQIHLDQTSNDDFLKQMLSNLPPSSFWNPNSDQNAPTNVVFPYDHHANLATKFRSHQITDDDTTTSTNNNNNASALMLHHHLLHAPFSFHDVDAPTSVTYFTPNHTNSSVQPLYSGSLQPSNHFQHPQGQSLGASAPASGGVGSGQPKQRVRARRGQATDPHSIAERLRRERIAERMKALQELVPNANKTDKASMLDEIIDYVKFLQLQVKVLSMSRLGGAAAVAPLVADMSSEGGAECVEGKEKGNSNDDSLALTEQQVAKLMEEDMGSAMQYLQGKGLCLMPISLATAISKATCRTFIDAPDANAIIVKD